MPADRSMNDRRSERPQRRGEGRVPPHNLQAEESVLGALLLSRDAIGQVSEQGLRPDDFYRPAHQHVFDAIKALYSSGGAVDVVTVADELRRAGLLDEVGGAEALHELQNATPAISSAGQYARIVQDTALLRRLIYAAGDIAELAYSEPDDVRKALDEAETKVFDIAEQTVTDSVRPLDDLLAEAMDRLQETFDRGDIITGVPTGYTDLDEILSGLQGSALYIVGARPAMGKTAFGLGMATHVAQHTAKPVLVFSLEMGHNELTQRILASEARVDSTKIRTGRLAEADWAKIGKAIGRLEVPLLLDDNPRVTVMEIRAKARRIKARYGALGLIVIDYLQLMSGHGNSENRQLEVSEISRNLKILARELEVPIVALSQLSRNLEARSDKRPMLSDLRESGCLTADTRLVRADTNAEITLGELVETGATDVPVWSLDECFRLVPANLTHAFASGVKETFRLRFASGRTIDASANHPFLTIDGWRRVEQLDVGEHLATARRIPERDGGADPLSDDELVLLAHLLGDGCTLDRHAIQYTTTDPANVAAVTGAAKRAFGIEPRVVAERTWTQVYLPSPRRLTHGVHHPISDWLRGLGVWNRRSWEKLVPPDVLTCTPRAIALFLRHLWATDGSVTLPRSGSPHVYYSTTSRRLADGVADLLLRLDIRCRVRTVPHPRCRTSYYVDICGRDEQLRFAEVVGVHGARAERLSELVDRVTPLVANTNVDIVPRAIWDHVRHKSLPEAGLTARQLAAGLEMSYCGSALYKSAPSRRRLRRVASITSDPMLRDLAESDVFWDRLVAIEPLGEQTVFDATIDVTHNFVANGVVAHNSLEQDADVVMFLYRDEVYNPESPDKGSAEVIVAKHRSGPIGTKRLVFLGQYTRFDNAARGV
jgi:replicative DNA helicase